MGKYLLVDDNEAFAENVAEILRDDGHEVVTSSAGEDALRRVRQDRFDVLITDMKMPNMGGARLVHELRRVDPGMPVIVITAYSGDEDLKIARAEGLLAILSKPPNLPRLRELLAVARRDGLVALIEDDEALSDNLSEVFRARGFTAVQAASVLEAEKMPSVRPFVAVTDLRVPGGPDGEAMRRLVMRYPGLPVVVITGHSDVVPPRENAGLFRKPFDPALLLARLEELHRERPRPGTA
ncbi:MAG TPA: response regulator [Myxococcaceae bacterium]|nr:response regulator [Myxococcaceae bacterium]